MKRSGDYPTDECHTAWPLQVQWVRGALFALLLVVLASSVSAQQAYLPSPGDRLRVRVHDRLDLSGEFDVREPGEISIPTLGGIPVGNRSLREVEAAIAGRLGLRPDGEPSLVSVEMAGFRSVYILGDVRLPGAYEYVPGMFVLQAIAIAGGYRRIEDESFVVQAEVARANERLNQTRESIGVFLASKARLEAENGGTRSIAFPAEIADYLTEARLAQVTANEKLLREMREETLSNTLDSLRGVRTVFEEEIGGHIRRIEAGDAQIRLIEAEIEEVSVTRGQVAPKTFVLGLRRLIARLEGEKGERVAFIARAKQQIESLAQDITRIVDARRVEVSEQLKAVEDELARLRITEVDLRRFLRTASRFPISQGGRDSSKATLFGGASVVRRGPAGVEKIDVGAMYEISPGDVVEILSPVD